MIILMCLAQISTAYSHTMGLQWKNFCFVFNRSKLFHFLPCFGLQSTIAILKAIILITSCLNRLPNAKLESIHILARITPFFT